MIFRHKKYDIKNNLRYFIVCSRIIALTYYQRILRLSRFFAWIH